MPENNEQLWDEFLTELELDYSFAAAKRVATDPKVWVEPKNLGPLPEKFGDRARNLVKLQNALVEQLAADQREVSKQLTALRSVPKRTQSPAFLDITG